MDMTVDLLRTGPRFAAMDATQILGFPFTRQAFHRQPLPSSTALSAFSGEPRRLVPECIQSDSVRLSYTRLGVVASKIA